MCGEHFGGGFGAAGEDDGIDAVVRDELLADGAAAAGGELQRRLRDAGSPETLAQLVGDEHGVGGRLENDGVAGGERGRDAAAWDGEREIPGRDDDDHAAATRRQAWQRCEMSAAASA